MFRALLPLLSLCLLQGQATALELANKSQAFRAYWYDQGAEMTRYKLQQSRYGQQRQGHAVLIFVTEPFDPAKQVKTDNPRLPVAVPMLKLNHTRNFKTGVYPYSVMRSTFHSLLPEGRALKSTTSVQEWCGHVFEQLNVNAQGWRLRAFSYFESEGDQDAQLAPTWLEDELWTQIRIDPTVLPVGACTMLPGAVFRRFQHLPAKPIRAVASWQEPQTAGGNRVYKLVYPELDRQLQLEISPAFPWSIEAWQEKYRGHLTQAVKTHRHFGPYWQWNGQGAAKHRSALGLPPDR